MALKRFLLGTALTGFASASMIAPAMAQTEITDDRTAGVNTSTVGTGGTPDDVALASTGSITVSTGAGVTIDSDNDVNSSGTIQSTDADNTVGILVTGASRTASISNAGTINLGQTPPDPAIAANGDIATGTGRIGILISGGTAVTGNVLNNTGGSIEVRGQDGAGIQLDAGGSITGDIINSGSIIMFGERNAGIDLQGNVIGNLIIGGNIASTGEDSSSVIVGGDISGGITVTSGLGVTGYVDALGSPISTRGGLTLREEQLANGSIRQAGPVMQINGDVGQGVHINGPNSASLNMLGSAPAILINGNGSQIILGRVGQITDVNDPDYDEDLLYSFVNNGSLLANGLFNDIDSNVFSLREATLTDGINNLGSMRASVFRSAIDPAATAATNDAHARVIVIGNAAIANRINNAGAITAIGTEAIDEAYADPENPLAANLIRATAIDIEAGGDLAQLVNTGTISANIFGRIAESIAIRDASGTLNSIDNQGTILATAASTDPAGEQPTNFTTTAIDLSANTAGATITQSQNPDDTNAPSITGDIILGTGADTLDIQAGLVDSAVEFGGGADTLTLSGNAVLIGSITDSGGDLDIVAADTSAVIITSDTDINVTSASFADGTRFVPFIDPSTGNVSTLNASGAVTFADGSAIAPRLGDVLDSSSATFTVVNAGTLTVDETLDSLRGGATSYLYDTAYTQTGGALEVSFVQRTAAQLGMDSRQASTYVSAFEALRASDPLGAAFVGLTDQTSFNAAYNQLMPEFAAAARQFVIANVDGSVGAVGSHLRNAARSPEQPGGAWIEEFAYFADRELAGLSEQYRGHGFGITGGFDTAFGPFHTAGINLGFATTEIEDVLGVDDPLDIITAQVGLYAGYQTGNLSIDGYAGYGYNDFEARRNVRVGAFDETADADWSGSHFNGSLSLGYRAEFGKFFVRPSVTGTYLTMTESAYTEEGSDDIRLMVDERTSDLGSLAAMLDIGRRYEGDRTWFQPAARIGYRNDIISDPALTVARFANLVSIAGPGAAFVVESAEFPESAFILGITFAAGSKYSSFSFDYDAELRDGFNRHTARLVLRLLF